MKITPTDLSRFTTTELRTLFRMVADKAARNPESSIQRREDLAALHAIGREISGRAGGPKPGSGS